MAISKSNKKPLYEEPSANEDIDFSAELIKQINKEAGNKIAFNLGTDEAPTTVKRWISTGSRQLDYIISNRRSGGVAEGRIVEIQGPPSSGKSHIAYEIAKSTQKMNGIVVYIDTENATSVENLEGLGIDIRKRFVFIQETCIEDIFKVIESTIEKARNLKADVPVTVIWDSVAASAPKAEIEGDYDQNTIGLAARVLSKGFRKVTDVIGDKNVCLVLLNQQRTKIGVMYGDPSTTPGGMAIPYHASTRIKLTGGQQIKQTINGKEAVVGINVTCKTIKNKVARPWREVSFEIHFGKGVREDENVFDELREFCEKCKDPVIFEGKKIKLEGTSQWKYFQVTDAKTGEVIVDEKFYKSEFGNRVLNNPEYADYVTVLMDATFIMKNGDESHKTVASIDLGSATEVEAVKAEKMTKASKSLLMD
jgi:recombination protein RecA